MSQVDGVKQSGIDWIGDVPRGWDLVRGRFLFSSRKELNHNLRCTNLLSLTLFGVLNKEFDSNDGLRPASYEGYQLFEADDLVFKLIDLENVKTSRVGIVHEPGIMSPVYIRFTPNHKSLYPKYAYWFYYDLYKKEIYNVLGSGVRSSLSASDLAEIVLPIPPLDEQRLIARYLDKKTQQIDTLIEKIEKKIELLKEQRTSLINHYVTKGLDPNVEMKDSGVEWIGKIPKHWSRVRIKHLVSTKVTDGPHETPTFHDSGVPFLSVEGIVGNTIDLNHVRGYISNEDHEIYSRKCKPKKYDVLLVKSGSTTGKSAIVEVDIDFNIWSPLCILRGNDSLISPYFFFQSIQSNYFLTQVQTSWSFGTQPNIGMGVIENLWVILPSKKEQEEILRYLHKSLSVTDDLQRSHEVKISLLKEYRQSLISSVVTGKVRVTEDMV